MPKSGRETLLSVFMFRHAPETDFLTHGVELTMLYAPAF
jgi:site-specific recombinase XerD